MNDFKIKEEVKEALYTLFKYCVTKNCGECPFGLKIQGDYKIYFGCVFNEYSQPFQFTNLIDILDGNNENIYD